MKYAIQGSGLSVPIVWYLCTGLNVPDVKDQATYDLESLGKIELGQVQTKEDVQALLSRLDSAREHLPNCEGPLLLELLAASKEDESIELAAAA